MRKGLLCGIVLAVLIAAVPTTAQAATSISQMFVGELNLLSDNDTQYFIDLVPDAKPTIINAGDLFVGTISFNTVEDLTGTGGTRSIGSGSVDELSAIFALKVIGLQDLGVGGGIYNILMAPVTAADTQAAVDLGRMSTSLKAELDSWMPGTLASVYNDPALDYTRVFDATYPGPDDGDPALTGADIGVGPFSAEEALLKAAYNWVSPGSATQVLELGFTGADLDGDGAPNAAAGEGWFAVGPDDVSVMRATPVPQSAGPAAMGLNSLVNNSGLAFAQIPTAFGGTAEFSGSGDIFGIGASNTPFDTFSNTDMAVMVIPEPASLMVWFGLAMVGVCGSAFGRRRRDGA